ncbi:MAG TPA: ankyrin repeat domain-containing protein [Blastocatellia bacterium]|nr:ankyrin repeat domain-containing protein [Blastocatellia bacterium]
MKTSIVSSVILLAVLFALACNGAGTGSRGPQDDALISAAREGHDDTVRSLLASPGVNVNARDGRGGTALIEASRYGHEDVVKALLAAGADVKLKDDDGRTALMVASAGGHRETVDLLRQAGAME